ncbi:MAG: hypothetical protein H6718_36775 [Polyangiaceae bacterium]|nr:hypothetical protein [Myxococcales bacterium]MCB9591018.1 hypothetical protein [Polyangiaceae bacterium]MCB9605181.1 hypothetical protein [Polyangiaceae bacterium]
MKLLKSPAWGCFALALLIRLVVVVWAAGRFPPAADGSFYQVVAERIASAQGYTWAWPDGTVTYAAHYPVGYPALVGALYWLFGPRPWVAMVFNAVLGAGAAWAGARLLLESGSQRGAWLGGVALACHPSLVFYTPALMTEGVVASGILLLAGLARTRLGRRRAWGAIALGVFLGVLTLVRPQVIVLAPLYGLLASRARGWRRLIAGAVVGISALCVTLPWTARNCEKMDRCVWVSANGGWNLLIGSGEKATGAWLSVEDVGFPVECREVWAEAAKDACFGAAARRRILEHPLGWLRLIPAKLSHTFDYGDAPGWYLHTANAQAFPQRAREALFVWELLWLRATILLLLFGLVVRAPRDRFQRLRWGLGLLAAPFLFLKWLWPAHLAILLLMALWPRQIPALRVGIWVLGSTVAIHAVFFGATRYGLVATPALVVAAIGVLTVRLRGGDTGGEENLDAAHRN